MLRHSDMLTPPRRERRKSPATSYASDKDNTSVQASPTCSSAADITFEPTIDMMINDFDDEATLNEEEALADKEAQNAEDEIATLREESEMPIEELLAKYSGMAASFSPATCSRRSGSSRRRRAAQRHHYHQHQETDESATTDPTEADCQHVANEPAVESLPSVSDGDPMQVDDDRPAILPPEMIKKSHRSHLLDLYPDESFEAESQAMDATDDLENFTPLQTLFNEEDAEEDEESDSDSEDTRKMIMVGSEYQAEIPTGLSQYGDVLPYENEDQLIWEPCQVSEREVEDYLVKVQETKALATAEEATSLSVPGETAAENTASVSAPSQSATTTPTAAAAVTSETAETGSVVKDNEQALHMLVQCGYDFKEALRRKRLNVLPLSSEAMSSWSEDECLKFEEGIQKFGKDFYQIRQNQVRTRTMRELVHFYYLWKKSERRDQKFALNDTIDHMDVFINEGGDRAGNGNGNENSNGTGSSPSHTSSNSNGHGLENGTEVPHHPQEAGNARKSASKSYSIMTGNSSAGTSGAPSRKRPASFALEEDDMAEDEAAGVASAD